MDFFIKTVPEAQEREMFDCCHQVGLDGSHNGGLRREGSAYLGRPGDSYFGFYVPFTAYLVDNMSKRDLLL